MAAWLSERDSFVFCACRIECETRGNLNLNMCVSCVRWLDCAPNWVRDLRSKPRIWRKGFYVTWNTLNKDRAACFWVGGGLFLAPLSLLNYFLSNLFLFCKKVEGREELKPPPSLSLCAVPLEKVFLFQTKLWLLYFNKEKALEILYNIHHMTKNESRYRTIAIFWVINYYFSKFCWLFPSKNQVSQRNWLSIA